MTKQLADFFQRRTLLEHAGGQAVAEKMGAHPWSCDASTLERRAYGKEDRTVREHSRVGCTGTKEYAAAVAGGPISMEVIRDSLGGIGRQRQLRPTWPLGRPDCDSRRLPVDVPKIEAENLSAAQAQARKQQQHCVIPTPERRMPLASAQHSLDRLLADVFRQAGQRPVWNIGDRRRQVVLDLAPVIQEAQERPQGRDEQLCVPRTTAAAYLPDEPNGVLEPESMKLDLAASILPEQELPDMPFVARYRREGEAQFGQQIASVVVDQAVRRTRRQGSFRKGGARDAYQPNETMEHKRSAIDRTPIPKPAAEESPQYTFVEITEVAMRPDQPSVETGDQLQVQPKRRGSITLALDQRGIRFDVCGKWTGVRPSETFRNSEWRVHPAIMAEGAGQRQATESSANDSGLCRIAEVAVRADQRRDAAYPAIRHSRGYLDFTRLARFTQAGAFFVIRAKSNLHSYVSASRPVDRTTGLRCDQSIRLRGFYSRQGYPDLLRRIRYVDAGREHSLVFLTNHFSLPAFKITEIYRSRWQIELFFRWIKQHLRIRSFIGTSDNAVRVQIWSAISTYLLVAILKKTLKLEPSLHEILQVLSVTPFEKVPVAELFASRTIHLDTRDFTDDIPNLF